MENREEMDVEIDSVSARPEFVDLKIVVQDTELFLSSVHSSETLHAIKQVLSDFQESAFLTCFHLSFMHYIDLDGKVVQSYVAEYGDYSVLNTFLEDLTKVAVFKVVNDLYDSKQIRIHVKRFRDICSRSHLVSASKINGKWFNSLVLQTF
jgi:hypothetical protein